MTAPIISSSVKTTPVSSRFVSRSTNYSGDKVVSVCRSAGKVVERSFDRSVPAPSSDTPDIPLILGGLVEMLQQGVVVISRTLQPLYWNVKAEELCGSLLGKGISSQELPAIVSEVCHRLTRHNHPSARPLVMECLTATGTTIRISARWFSPEAICRQSHMVAADAFNPVSPMSRSGIWQPCILVFLENCADTLQGEMDIERKKYDLTEREAEIWKLLRQEYTYQEISKILQISLNTVKTHVKNVYAKRRSFQGQERFWVSE